MSERPRHLVLGIEQDKNGIHWYITFTYWDRLDLNWITERSKPFSTEQDAQNAAYVARKTAQIEGWG